MQQMISDIDPWKFKTFTMDECPVEVLEKLPFGECINIYQCTERSTHSYLRPSAETTLTDSIAKTIIDKARTYNKEFIFPELQCGNIGQFDIERVKTYDNHIYGYMYTTRPPRGLIKYDDPKASLEYWQDTYVPIHNVYIKSSITNRFIPEVDVTNFPYICIPKVYYDVTDDLIYNRVYKLREGEYGFIPVYSSSIDGGVIIVKATDDCLVPLGTGRINTLDRAYNDYNVVPEMRERRREHSRGVINNNYSCLEFNDKHVLMNVINDLPLEIVYEMNTYSR